MIAKFLAFILKTIYKYRLPNKITKFPLEFLNLTHLAIIEISSSKKKDILKEKQKISEETTEREKINDK